MDIDSVRLEMKKRCDSTEDIFLDLADAFSALLNKEGASIEYMKSLLQRVVQSNDKATQKEKAMFQGFEGKYAKTFESLNLKIGDLEEANKQVSSMKIYSEEIELIAMNAMVISIKSGEKGKAFSSITENLQRLSSDMILFSNRLIEEENALMQHIQNIKDVFNDMVYMHKTLSQMGQSSNTDLLNMVDSAFSPLNKIKLLSQSVYPNIQKAMEGLQLQDIIRQALEQVLLCLAEMNIISRMNEDQEDYIDAVCYNLKMAELVEKLLSDISKNLEKSIDLFSSNWNNVTNILDEVEHDRTDYLEKFLDEMGQDKNNILRQLEFLSGKFQEMMEVFGKYQNIQKELIRLCQGITEKARAMYTVFESLKSVVSRLHHVRILQGIEVNKNPAIETVRDSVNDMDALINNSNEVLDKLQDIIESFMNDITSILDNFSNSISADSEQMVGLRLFKTDFFDSLKNARQQMSHIFTNFVVFPHGFDENCQKVKENISSLNEIIEFFGQTIQMFKEEQNMLQEKKTILLQQKGLSDWEVQNDKFKEIIQKFTITSHKEVAGEIAGFDVEAGTQAGDITFF